EWCRVGICHGVSYQLSAISYEPALSHVPARQVQPLRQLVRPRSSDEHLALGFLRQAICESPLALAVQLRKHIVEQQRRLCRPSLSQRVQLEQLECNRRGALLSGGSHAAQRPPADFEHQVVAVRPDRGGSPHLVSRRGGLERRCPCRWFRQLDSPVITKADRLCFPQNVQLFGESRGGSLHPTQPGPDHMGTALGYPSVERPRELGSLAAQRAVPLRQRRAIPHQRSVVSAISQRQQPIEKASP